MSARSARRKTWQEKLADSKGLPKVAPITGKMTRKWGEGTMVVPAPMEVDELMRKVGKGKKPPRVADFEKAIATL